MNPLSPPQVPSVEIFPTEADGDGVVAAEEDGLEADTTELAAVVWMETAIALADEVDDDLIVVVEGLAGAEDDFTAVDLQSPKPA